MVPLFHYVGSPLLLAILVWTAWRLARAPSADDLLMFLIVFVLALVGFFARHFALGVQDRVIRLEERLRMERLFDGALRARIPDLTTEQLIGLRFASDEELPELARRVLDEGIADRRTIKKAIKRWRADLQRI
jgi:hypothetical protein